MRDARNILKNAARLGASKELVRKAVGKYLEPPSQAREVLDWCERNATDIQEWLQPESLELWDEAQRFADQLRNEAQRKLESLGVNLGGGGHYALLYFLIRSRKPETAVETGVAAGFSSKAILAAMEKNSRGWLYSSDFPYCRLEQPEKYIGILVDEPLRRRWDLHIKGDRKNLMLIRSKLEPESVGLFHYDSDKSYSGREFALQTMKPYLSRDCICIFDDIQNNWHFRDLVNSASWDWCVFEFAGKYLGLTKRNHEKVG